MAYQTTAAHGQIYLPQQQNLNYFSNDDFYRKGIGYYYSLFSQAHEGLTKGDVAPDYLLYPQKVLKRLRFLYNGDMSELRFVVYLKNPVVRLLDDYLNNRDSGLEELPLERAIEREQELLSNAMFTRKGMSLGLYLNSSRYHSLLKPWLSVFHPEQVLCDNRFRPARKPQRAPLKACLSFWESIPIMQPKEITTCSNARCYRIGWLEKILHEGFASNSRQ